MFMETKDTQIINLSRYLVQKHYGENDVEAMIAKLDDNFTFIGAGENEYVLGKDAAVQMYHSFANLIPKCIIEESHFDVQWLAPTIAVATGRAWIKTDPSTKIYLRVHQRFTFIFNIKEDEITCTHMHCSNPYIEMKDDETGFPMKMAEQTYKYLQDTIAEYKEKIATHIRELEKLSFEDHLTKVFNKNKYEQLLDISSGISYPVLGIAYFDLNGLKVINDTKGHVEGDNILCASAKIINNNFNNMVYRIGDDDFLVVDYKHQKDDFESRLKSVIDEFTNNSISCSVGYSFKDNDCNIEEQFNTSYDKMYHEKREYYKNLMTIINE